MEPVSTLALIGTCVGLVASTTKTIKTLNDLKSKFSEVEVEISRVLSQVSTVQTSVQAMRRLLNERPPTLESNTELGSTIEQALNCCIVIISAIEKHISRIDYDDGVVPVIGKIRHVLSEDELKNNQEALGRQIQALTLLLQIIQMKSVFEQKQFIVRPESRTVFKRARDDASSFVDLSGEQLSMLEDTIGSDGSADLDAIFDFDNLALDSKAYRSALRSLLKREFEEKRKQNYKTTTSSSRKVTSEAGPSGLHTPTSPEAIPGESSKGSIPSGLSRDMSGTANGIEGSAPMCEISHRTRKPVSLAEAFPGIIDDLGKYQRPLGILRFHILGASGLRKAKYRPSKTHVWAWPNYESTGSMRAPNGGTLICKNSINPIYNEVFYTTFGSFEEVILLSVVDNDDGGNPELHNTAFMNFEPLKYLPKDQDGVYIPEKNTSLKLRLRYKDDLPTESYLDFEVALYPCVPLARSNVWRPPKQHAKKLPKTIESLKDSSFPRILNLNYKGDLAYRSGVMGFRLSWQNQTQRMNVSLYVDDSPHAQHVFDSKKCQVACNALEGFLVIPDTHTSKVHIEVWVLQESMGVRLRGELQKNVTELMAQDYTSPKILKVKLRPGRPFSPDPEEEFKLTTFFIPTDRPMASIENFSNTGSLRMDVLYATGLPYWADWGKLYFVCFLDEQEVFRTEMVKPTIFHPTWLYNTGSSYEVDWDESFNLPIPSRKEAVLKLHLMEFRRLSWRRHRLLSEHDISLSGLLPYRAEKQMLTLDIESGTVTINLLFQPTSGTDAGLDSSQNPPQTTV